MQKGVRLLAKQRLLRAENYSLKFQDEGQYQRLLSNQLPHTYLSIGKLKKRLYRAGVRGWRVAAVAREIYAGPTTSALAPDARNESSEKLRLGWPIETLEARFGHRLTRQVTRFVDPSLSAVNQTVQNLSNFFPSGGDFLIAKIPGYGLAFTELPPHALGDDPLNARILKISPDVSALGSRRINMDLHIGDGTARLVLDRLP